MTTVADHFSPCMQILPAAQQVLWPQLQPLASMGFVLYGGTAIALRLGHRQSVDFDFFCSDPLNKAKLATQLPFVGRATVLQDQANAWTLLVNTGNTDQAAAPTLVKVSFFGTIAFGHYSKPQWTTDEVLKVASLDDLMATKVKVLLQRVESKDYQDIAAMLRSGVDLSRGLAIAREMFGSSFQPSESLKAMTWFNGGDLELLTDNDKQTLVRFAADVRKLPIVTQLGTTLA